jgi:hypothetical protein
LSEFSFCIGLESQVWGKTLRVRVHICPPKGREEKGSRFEFKGFGQICEDNDWLRPKVATSSIELWFRFHGTAVEEMQKDIAHSPKSKERAFENLQMTRLLLFLKRGSKSVWTSSSENEGRDSTKLMMKSHLTSFW